MNVCPYCNKEILTEEETRICEKCGVVYHKSCWDANGGCATFACENNISAGTAPKTPSFCAKCGSPLNEMGLCSVCSTGSTVTAKKKFNLTAKNLKMIIIIAASVLVLLAAGLILLFAFRDTRGGSSPEEVFETETNVSNILSSEEINVNKAASMLYDCIPEDMMNDYLYALGLEGKDQKEALKESIVECYSEKEYHEISCEYKIKNSKLLSERKKKEIIEEDFDDDKFYDFYPGEITEIYEIDYLCRYTSEDKVRSYDDTAYVYKYKGAYYSMNFSNNVFDMLEEIG